MFINFPSSRESTWEVSLSIHLLSHRLKGWEDLEEFRLSSEPQANAPGNSCVPFLIIILYYYIPGPWRAVCFFVSTKNRRSPTSFWSHEKA